LLTVAYKGQVTHHQIVKEDKISKNGVSTEFKVNGTDTGCRTLHKTIAYLTQAREPWWPLALTSQVMSNGAVDDEPGAEAFYENTGETGDWTKAPEGDADEQEMYGTPQLSATDEAGKSHDGGDAQVSEHGVDAGGGVSVYMTTKDQDIGTADDFEEPEDPDAHPTTLAERLEQLERNKKRAEVTGIKKRQDSIKFVSGEIRRR